MKYINLAFVTLITSFSSYSSNWVTLNLTGKAAHDLLSGPTISLDEVSHIQSCTYAGVSGYSCGILPVINIASSVKCTIPRESSTQSATLAWTVNNVPNDPTPAMGSPSINYVDNNGKQGWQLSQSIPNLCSGENHSVFFSEPIYLLITNGPSGYYIYNGNKYYAIQQGTPVYARYTMRGTYVYQGSAFESSTIIIPPDTIDPVDVQCDFSIDGDIDLGAVDSSSASGRYASTYLYTQCTDDATVTAKIQKSGGGDNLLQMGGLNLRVIFDNSSDTKTYSANTSRNSQIIWGQVTSVGTLTPGEYSQSMVVYLNYE